METRLKQVLQEQGANYILPFFWQHGEDEVAIRLGMEKISESRIGAVCVESRPHPNFLGPKWWHDLDIIMDEARKRNMKVWVFDDSHFPSGYVNGAVKKHPEARKQYCTHYCIDVIGPMDKAAFMVELKAEEELIAVIAGKRDRSNQFSLSEPIDLTNLVNDDLLYWDVPSGFWCVTVIKSTYVGAGRPNYINPIDRNSVKLFIDTVHEAYYQRYKKDFGKTFAGFFSDEPELGNAAGGKYGHRATIGTYDLPLSWSKELEQKLRELWGNEYGTKLAALWHQIDQISHCARYDYMDIVTQLYGEHFCGQIGDWCRARGVEYIGHVIEDGNCHSATGLGTGHFFRALWGQDMSGIDVVLQQIRPGLDDTAFYRIGGTQFYQGQFFHYGLAKLGASLGHLDPKKKGRTLCEVFGAYGWAEGLKLMKWLADHMLVRGVNHFIPHAFTLKDFPDPDCPPHFYGGGMNPQYPYFKYLMDYMNRVSHLINGGQHVPSVAILYDAESDWAGEYEPVEVVGRILAQNQIDYEIIPADLLVNATVKAKQLLVGKETCQALIIPKCEYIPASVIKWCHQAMEQDLLILSLEDSPKAIECEMTLKAPVVKNNFLVDTLRSRGVEGLKLTKAAPDLRYYHYKQPGSDFYLLFNESPTETISTGISNFKDYQGSIYEYDAFDNRIYQSKLENGVLEITLTPYQATIIVLGEVEPNLVSPRLSRGYEEKLIKGPWKLECMEVGNGTIFAEQIDSLYDITAPEHYPYFSGTMDYETIFVLEDNLKEVALDLGSVYETAEIWVNGQAVGVRIAPPYQIAITDYVKPGKNQLKIRVVNHLGHRQRDHFSVSMPLEPSGLLGPVVLKMK